MSTLVQAYDLAEYEDFINQEQFAGRPLADMLLRFKEFIVRIIVRG